MAERKGGNTVVVVDGGGRGHALTDAYLRSPQVDQVFAIPGNDLTGRLNTRGKLVVTHPELKTTSLDEIVGISEEIGASLVDVAQDNAVAAGVVDALKAKGIPVVGPTASAGMIESDKAWARELGDRAQLPQPFFRICTSPSEGYKFLESQPDQPWFVKAAGLAEGKGALPAENADGARSRIRELSKFGKAGEVFSIERWLRNDDGTDGEEFSTFALSDGKNVRILGSAQDHKRLYDGDTGPNTGGMGCSAQPLLLTPDLMGRVERGILDKAIKGMYSEGNPYTGVLYLGGMAIHEGNELNPYVIEFNARWGDPEAEVLLPGIITDLFSMSMAVAQGDISGLNIRRDNKARVAVAGASRGYSSDGGHKAVIGKEIKGLNAATQIPGVTLYGAGVKVEDERYYANGGRLFYMVGEGTTVVEARERAYEAMAMVSIEGDNLQFRTDIGWRDVARLRGSK